MSSAQVEVRRRIRTKQVVTDDFSAKQVVHNRILSLDLGLLFVVPSG